MRICSLQPGATEIVYALGVQDQLYGVTSKCDYPAEARDKPVVVSSIFDGQHLSSGEISRTIAQQFHKGQKIYEVDQEVLEVANPDLLLTQAICEV
jgi:iron complex transport system substrate-binding protein